MKLTESLRRICGSIGQKCWNYCTNTMSLIDGIGLRIGYVSQVYVICIVVFKKNFFSLK